MREAPLAPDGLPTSSIANLKVARKSLNFKGRRERLGACRGHAQERRSRRCCSGAREPGCCGPNKKAGAFRAGGIKLESQLAAERRA
jgi:hypothetical protein